MGMRATAGLCALLVASAAMLTGCSVASTPAAPLNKSEQLARYSATIAETWGPAALVFPDPGSKSYGFAAIDDPDAWAAGVNGCFADNGVTNAVASTDFTVSVTGTVVINTTNGDQEGDSGFFACVIRFPSPKQLASLLSDSQISALYDYKVGIVVPCLLRHGVTPSAPPSRAKYVKTFYTGANWDPLRPLGGPIIDNDLTQKLNLECPPEPKWMPRQQ